MAPVAYKPLAYEKIANHQLVSTLLEHLTVMTAGLHSTNTGGTLAYLSSSMCTTSVKGEVDKTHDILVYKSSALGYTGGGGGLVTFLTLSFNCMTE